MTSGKVFVIFHSDDPEHDSAVIGYYERCAKLLRHVKANRFEGDFIDRRESADEYRMMFEGGEELNLPQHDPNIDVAFTSKLL